MNNEQKEPIEQIEEIEQAEQKAETEQSKDSNKKEKKSIKKFFKEIFEDLKLKPTTIENARKRTQALCKLLGVGGGILSVLFLIISPGIAITMAIAIAVLIAGLCLRLTLKTERNFCGKCKTKYNYDTDISWEVIRYDEERVSGAYNNPNQKNCVQKRYATIKFRCACSNCNSVNEFTERKEVVKWYSDGTISEKNVSDIARSYFQL